MSTGESDVRALAEVAAELCAVAPEDFVATRDARAASLRGDDRDLAARVKKLRKPSAAAWALNRLAAAEADALGGLDDVGRRMRDAQTAGDGPALKDLRRELRSAVDDLVGRAGHVAREGGHPLSATLREEVAGTLRAVGADPGVAAAVRSGLLLKTVSATGLDRVDVDEVLAVPEAVEVPEESGDDGDLLVVAPVTDLGDARARREERRARERVEAERRRRLGVARRAAEAAERARDDARTADEEAQAAVEQARARLAEAQESLEAAESRAGETGPALQEAETALEQATSELAEVEEDPGG